jgi:hypothetical protein
MIVLKRSLLNREYNINVLKVLVSAVFMCSLNVISYRRLHRYILHFLQKEEETQVI